MTAWANLVVALVALALAILLAEDQWLLVVASWYLAGSWFACALTSIRCLPTQTESPVTWSFSVRPQRHRRGDAATGAQHAVAAASAFDSRLRGPQREGRW